MFNGYLACDLGYFVMLLPFCEYSVSEFGLSNVLLTLCGYYVSDLGSHALWVLSK